MVRLKPYPKQAIISVMQQRERRHDRRRELLHGETIKRKPKTPGWKPKKTVIDIKKLQKESSFWQPGKWPEWWQEGAQELEKTAPGRIITAPVRITDTALQSTRKTVEEIPAALKTVVKTLPIVALAGILLGGAYFVYRFKKDKREKISPY